MIHYDMLACDLMIGILGPSYHYAVIDTCCPSWRQLFMPELGTFPSGT